MSVHFSSVQYTKTSDGDYMVFEGRVVVRMLEVLSVTRNPHDFLTQHMWDAVLKEARSFRFEPGNVRTTEVQPLAALVSHERSWMFKIRIDGKEYKNTDGKPPSAVGMSRPDAEWAI